MKKVNFNRSSLILSSVIIWISYFLLLAIVWIFPSLNILTPILLIISYVFSGFTAGYFGQKKWFVQGTVVFLIHIVFVLAVVIIASILLTVPVLYVLLKPGGNNFFLSFPIILMIILMGSFIGNKIKSKSSLHLSQKGLWIGTCIVAVLTVPLFIYGMSNVREESAQTSVSIMNQLYTYPETKEEAQTLADFIILRPNYKPEEYALYGDLRMYGENKFVKITYDSISDDGIHNTIQIDERKATGDEQSGDFTRDLEGDLVSAEKIVEIDVCGSKGYLGERSKSQQLVFLKEETHVLMTIFPEPLPQDELVKTACSLQSLLIPF